MSAFSSPGPESIRREMAEGRTLRKTTFKGWRLGKLARKAGGAQRSRANARGEGALTGVKYYGEEPKCPSIGFSNKRSPLNLVGGVAGAEIRSQWTGRDLI